MRREGMMAAWVKATHFEDRQTIYVNLDQASRIERLPGHAYTSIRLLDRRDVNVIESPEDLVRPQKTQ